MMAKAKVTDTGTIHSTSVIIEVPIGDIQGTGHGIRIEGRLSPRASNALQRIKTGLNGQLSWVTDEGIKHIHAIRFVLEAIADQIERTEKTG